MILNHDQDLSNHPFSNIFMIFLLDSIRSVPRWPTRQTLPDRCSRASSSSMPVWTTKQWHEALFCLHFHAQQFRWPIQFRCLRYSTYMCWGWHVFRWKAHILVQMTYPYWWRCGQREFTFPFGDAGNKIKWQHVAATEMRGTKNARGRWFFSIMGPSSTNRLGRKHKNWRVCHLEASGAA